MAKGKNKASNELVTKRMLQEAVDAILGGMDKLFSEFRNENKIEHMEINRQLSDLKYDMPSMKEFNKLKNDFDKHVENHLQV